MRTLIIEKPLGTRLLSAEILQLSDLIDEAYAGGRHTAVLALACVTSVAVSDDTLIICLMDPPRTP